MSAAKITFEDLKRAISDRSPEAAELVVRYLEQPDPLEDRPEGAADDAQVAPLPPDNWTLARARSAIHPNTLEDKTEDERRALRKEVFANLMAAPYHPPRLDLGPLLIAAYETGEPWSAALCQAVFKRARIGWGIWQAFKAIYKQAEENHDIAMFGVLAWRLDVIAQTPYHASEILPGTLLYMRRRAWRYLRELGSAVPDLYPSFAVQVLRHYEARNTFTSSWVANQIWAHQDLLYDGSGSAWMHGPPAELKKRYAHEAWKQSPDPVLRLLEDAENDAVTSFAIRCITADFPETKKNVDPAWLRRIGEKRLASVHTFVVELLLDSPALHTSKIRSVGLEDTVISFLDSDSDTARTYAIEYARANVPSLPVARMVELVAKQKDVSTFVLDRLAKLGAKTIGLGHLVRMLDTSAAVKLATEKIQEGYSPADLDVEQFIGLYTGGRDKKAFVTKFYAEKKVAIPAPFFTQLLEHRSCGWTERREALAALSKRTGREIGIDWIKTALMNNRLQGAVSEWLVNGMLAGDDLDVEWLKSLVVRPALEQMAITILSNPKLVRPSRIGLPWLLALTRQPNESLSSFANRYLLEHFTPDEMGGIDRLWELVTKKKQPEPVRVFAEKYLEVHHPKLGPTTTEARSLGIKPRLDESAYRLDRLRDCFFDDRQDVRQFAVRIGKYEIVRWNDAALPYELANSPYREARALAAEALFGLGDEDADLTTPIAWLDAAKLFALAESHVKATREIALTLIRKHYQHVEGPRRLAWLMESPDRDVRLFAVRLLWDRHRPGAKSATAFESIPALRLFLRTVLFGLPPGRLERRELSDAAAPDRPLPSSVAKRRLIEVIRDLAIEDAEFADVVIVVLDEFMASAAKGEWQACVAAIARIRQVHQNVQTDLVSAVRI